MHVSPHCPVKCSLFIDSDITVGLRSVVPKKKQHQTEIYGAYEQLVDLGSTMRGCNSEGPSAEVERGPCCGLVWQQRRAELAPGCHTEAKEPHTTVPLSQCAGCVSLIITQWTIHPHTLRSHCMSPWSVQAYVNFQMHCWHVNTL